MGNHPLLQGDLPDPGIERRALALQANSLLLESRLECKSTNFEGRQINPQAYGFRPHSNKLSLI